MSSSATFPRDWFASLLGDAAVAGAFSARRTARPDDLRLEVGGVGPIALPVSVRRSGDAHRRVHEIGLADALVAALAERLRPCQRGERPATPPSSGYSALRSPPSQQ